MRKLLVASAAIVVCLTLGGLPVAAQEASPSGHAWVTGSQDCTPEDEGTWTKGADSEQFRGQVFSCVVATGDPRVNGPATVRMDHDCYWPLLDMPTRWSCVYWGTTEFSGPAGTWAGEFRGVQDPLGKIEMLAIAEGAGGYEGWTFASRSSFSTHEPGATIEGFIYQGPPPAQRPTPSPASE